jgi:hypothetical protein
MYTKLGRLGPFCRYVKEGSETGTVLQGWKEGYGKWKGSAKT